MTDPGPDREWSTSGRDEDARIQLLVDEAGNRAALRSLLEQRYETVVDESVRDAALHVVDDTSLPAYRDALAAHSREAHPTFAPTVLVRREDTHIDVELALSDGDDPAIVDEIVAAPVDRQRLFRRLENLLVRRRQSIELSRRYEASEARFEGLFRAVPDPAFVLDAEGAIIEANEAFADVTALGDDATVGFRPHELDVFEADTLDAFTDAADERVAYRDADGERRYAEVRTRRRSVAGETYTVVVMHDVTALHESNERLEQFTSVVTHDLRNPLQVAQARVPMVESAVSDDGRAADHLDVVANSLDRIDDLVAGVRTLVRDTGVEAVESVALDDVAERAWRLVETANEDPRFADASRTLYADPGRLQQLLANLFRNAHDHGGGDVTVTVGTTTGGFYVADDGPGIPPSERDDVLETGYTTASDGTGLGLSIVSAIADGHGWTMSVTASESGGARFEFTGVEFV
ncbi:MAG: ATP-binding protein [Halarchaeum sp.]